LAVDERREVIFFDLSRDVAVATNFFSGGIDLQYTNTHRVVHMTFATAAQHTTRRAVAMQVAGKQIT